MRILFADDSMTAQNMGKKILTEAGYEVVAVSNGAAAVKKIAEHKPDIIILDIYMPGYTGLEVCDKVRGSADTLRTPVLLTVGKMEPYRAEDANRVKADGVIIKPFEASDLLAVIKKLEERVVPKSAVTEQTVVLERPPEFTEFPQAATENHSEVAEEATANTVQATVDVPDNMATAAAFSDLLGTEPAHSFGSMPLSNDVHAGELAVVPDLSVEPPATLTDQPEDAGTVRDDVPITEFGSFPAQEAPTATAELTPATEADPPASASFTTPDFSADMGADATNSATSHSAASEEGHSASAFAGNFAANEPAGLNIETEAGPLPVVTVPFIHEREPEPVPTAPGPSLAADGGTIAPSPAEELKENVNAQSSAEPDSAAVFAAATLPAPDAPPPSFIDPGLEVNGLQANGLETNAIEFDPFSARVEAQIQQIETIVSASEARHTEAAPAQAAADDFEARVAAAMSAYDQPLPVEDHTEPEPAVHDAGPEVSLAAAQGQSAHESVSEPAAFEAPYSFEYSPPIVSPEPAPAASSAEPVKEIAHAPAAETPVRVGSAHESAQAVGEIQVPSHAEPPSAWQYPSAPQAEEARFDEETVIHEVEAQLPAPPAAGESGGQTQLIASAVHRVLERLKPHLIEEISRELKSPKTPEEK